ncbi:hydroxyproline-rich glycoprotein family protein [Forsythia ovata]|uniref:Hydroxyproline-rich glycoprotein family protein n=1 Tax=Forsythia ovata TaxID=205694 RepID=A0ABD1WVT1_9LAMI
MDADGDSPPFWSQPTTTTFFLPQRRRPQPSPINPVALILAVPILILVIIFFLVPPFLSHTTQILRPASVKKSWDSLNVLLVLFAIICGVFFRRNDEVSSSEAADQQNLNVSPVPDFVRPPGESVSSAQWFGFSDGKEYGGNVMSTPVGDGGGTRLRRSSSSYPDLRQESLWENRDNRFRYFDDFEVKSYRTSPVAEHFHRRARRNEAERDEPDTPIATTSAIAAASSEVSFSGGKKGNNSKEKEWRY